MAKKIKKTLEELALEIFNECEKDGEPVTMEEAREMAEEEIKASGISNYTKAEVTSEEDKKKKRENKPKPLDEDKVKFLKELLPLLETHSMATDCVISNPQREISFKVGNDNYSLVLTKHRPEKKKEV